MNCIDRCDFLEKSGVDDCEIKMGHPVRDGAQSEEKLSKEARKGIGTTPIPFLMENHPPN
ncbi:hypothetical protein D4T97_011595 [Siminovitchia acidinfaciens]|uniref:Uncharacterized protein n=1 Tax=Siminovitchia acidinfaciens TaxID=2321395 RepID=A0A429XZW5_9BACI|nr:hypothetical protein D4T97_011595 [Siminovitchia acidinfaciens]